MQAWRTGSEFRGRLISSALVLTVSVKAEQCTRRPLRQQCPIKQHRMQQAVLLCTARLQQLSACLHAPVC
jgi:hypothetical protein